MKKAHRTGNTKALASGLLIAGVVVSGSLVLLAGCGVAKDADPSVTRPHATRTMPTVHVTASLPHRTRSAEAVPSGNDDTETHSQNQDHEDAQAIPDPPDSNDELPWWAWLILAFALAGAASAVWFLTRGIRARKDWDRTYAMVRGELNWVDMELIPRVLAASSTAEASGLWQGARPRLDVADQDLRSLATARVDQGRLSQANLVRTRLGSLVAAMDAEASVRPDADAEALRSAQAHVESARMNLRTALGGAEPPPAGV